MDTRNECEYDKNKERHFEASANNPQPYCINGFFGRSIPSE